MNNIVRIVVAVIAGILAGSLVNMGLVILGGSVIPPPAGVDPTDMESIRAGMHLYKVKHFISPFAAHAMGTLIGALVASLIATKHNLKLAVGIGVFFLLGGITASLLIPAPRWFIALDLFAAYLPMAWLGWKLSSMAK